MRLNNKNSRAIGELVKEVDYLKNYVNSIVNENLALEVTPAVLGSSAEVVNTAIGGTGFERSVECKVVNGSGEALTYFNGTLPISVEVTTAGTGDATIVDSATEATFVNGIALVTIDYTGAWAGEDTCTFTLGNTSKIAGVTLDNVTSVDTLIA